MMNTNYCKQCGHCCDNIAVDFDKNILYRDGIEQLSPNFAEMLIKTSQKENITLCTCKYLTNNICTNPNKPNECLTFPSSPFAFLPENCGYNGLIFIKKEHIKQKIRKLKEEILDYESQLKKDKNLQKIIDRHNAFIQKYAIYGSEDW